MAVINVNEFKPGITFLKDGDPYIVINAQHSKQGRGQANVKAKVKNLRSGSTTTMSFTGGDKVDKAFVEKNEMQFLFTDGTNATFMDNTTFEQVEIPEENIAEQMLFIKPESNVLVTSYESLIIGVELPKNVEVEITETADAVRGDTVTNATKKAKIESGLEIDVPQFINLGDKIVINTETKKYVGKA